MGENDSGFGGSIIERSNYLIIVFDVWCFPGRTRVALVASENKLTEFCFTLRVYISEMLSRFSRGVLSRYKII